MSENMAARRNQKLARIRSHSESLREFATTPVDKQRADDMLWVLDQYDALEQELTKNWDAQ